MINGVVTALISVDPYALVIGVITLAGVIYSAVGGMCYSDEEVAEWLADK
jgi:hypothetical protein